MSQASRTKKLFPPACALSFLAILATALQARGDESADALAKATANPIADLISLPLQSNWDRGYGPGDNTQYTLNIQPVIPFQLNEDWNLITRTILPVVHQPALAAGQNDLWGTGDIVASQFFSPRNSGGLIWGVGTVFLIPSASDSRLGSKKWGAGPTGVVLIQDGPWTYGGLANHLRSVAGSSDRARVNASFLNPFVTYGLGGGWSTTFAAEYTYNWDASSELRTTLPLIASVAKVTRFGKQPVSLALGYKYYADSPSDQLDNGLRFSVNFLFPK